MNAGSTTVEAQVDDAVPELAQPDWSRESLLRVMPARSSFLRDVIDDVLVLMPEGVCFAQKGRSAAVPSREKLGIETVEINCRIARRTACRMRWEHIERITCSYPCEVGLLPSQARRIGCDLCIVPSWNVPVRVFLPHDDAKRVIEVARFHIGAKVHEDVEPFTETRLTHHSRVIEVLLASIPCVGVLLLTLFLPIALLGWRRGWFEAMQSTSGASARGRARRLVKIAAIPVLTTAFATALSVAAFWCGPGLGEVVRLVAWLATAAAAIACIVCPLIFALRYRGVVMSFPRRRLDVVPPRRIPRRHWFESMCGYWPESLRGPGWSIALRFLGVLVLFAAYLAPKLWKIPLLEMVTVSSAMAVAGAMAYLGYRIGSHSATRLRERDARAPILYLRSFRDDGCGTYNASDWRTTLLGVQNFQGLRILGPISQMNPIRLMRLIAGRGDETAEEQLAGYFRRHGPFIAIGRPSEGLPTSGAARDYVSGEVWRARIEQWMAQARMVVIQPGASDGVWWEIKRALELVPRERILFSLVAFDRRDADYEAFALRIRTLLGIEVPIYRGDLLFLGLEEGRVVLIPRIYRSPIAWPVSGCTVDLRQMVDPRFDRVAPIAPAPRWRPGGWIFDATAMGSVLLWAVPSLGFSAVVGAVTSQIAEGFRIEELARAPLGTARVPLEWAGVRWQGGDLLVPSTVSANPFVAPGIEIGGQRLLAPAPPGVTDSTAACRDFATLYLGVDDSCRYTGKVVAAGGRQWTEHRYPEVNTPAGPYEVVIRATRDGPQGLVHWGMRSLSLPYEVRSAFEQLLDSVEFAPMPAEGKQFVCEPGDGWSRVAPSTGAVAEFRRSTGEVFVVEVTPMAFRLTERDLLEAVRAQNPQAQVTPSGSRGLEGGGHEYVFVILRPLPEGQSLAYCRWVFRQGWCFCAVVASGRGLDALHDLEVAAHSLRFQ